MLQQNVTYVSEINTEHLHFAAQLSLKRLNIEWAGQYMYKHVRTLSVIIPSAREPSASAVGAGSSEALPPSLRCPRCPFLITEESLASVSSRETHRSMD